MAKKKNASRKLTFMDFPETVPEKITVKVLDKKYKHSAPDPQGAKYVLCLVTVGKQKPKKEVRLYTLDELAAL